MSTVNKSPFTSFVNTYCGLLANQVSDMSSQFDKIVTQSNALFDELALRGEAVEAEIKKSIPGNMKMNKSIKSWFDTLSFGSAKRDKQIDDLSKKVDGLIDVVAVLAEKQAKAKTASKPVTRKPKVTKAAAVKPTAEKPVASKPTAKKPATRKPVAKSTTAKSAATGKPAVKKPSTNDS
jgi:cell division septation protein DedD